MFYTVVLGVKLCNSGVHLGTHWELCSFGFVPERLCQAGQHIRPSIHHIARPPLREIKQTIFALSTPERHAMQLSFCNVPLKTIPILGIMR